MTEYLLLFRNASASDGYLVSTSEMAEDMPKWQAWIGHIALQGKLIQTSPIKYDGFIVDQHGSVIEQPHKSEDSTMITGFLICRADNLEEVQNWSKDCPILRYPHSSVEIRPFVPFVIN